MPMGHISNDKTILAIQLYSINTHTKRASPQPPPPPPLIITVIITNRQAQLLIIYFKLILFLHHVLIPAPDWPPDSQCPLALSSTNCDHNSMYTCHINITPTYLPVAFILLVFPCGAGVYFPSSPLIESRLTSIIKYQFLLYLHQDNNLHDYFINTRLASRRRESNWVNRDLQN